MKLVLYREKPIHCTTPVIGTLWHEARKICDTLEPHIGYPRGEYTKGCCIPPGTYRLELTGSIRFRKTLPEILDVPKRSGIRIHAGNYEQDTVGCILPGTRDKSGMCVNNSRAALDVIMRLLYSAGGKAEIQIIEKWKEEK